jgi:hypothetical protein
MNLRTAIRRILKSRPTTLAGFQQLGLSLKTIDAGVFRKTCEVEGLPLAVKFPLDKDGVYHSRTEMRKIARLSLFPSLRKYLPKIYYYDSKSGVIVERFYPNFSDDIDACEAVGNLAGVLLKELTGVKVIDIHSGNIRTKNPRRESPKVVLVDLGY